MEQQPSYCLVINVGRSEQARQELIAFLEGAAPLSVSGKVWCGMWNGRKLLRVETTDAEGLREIITDEFRIGDDCEYEVHHSAIDAQRSMTWLPDFDTPLGYKGFRLSFV
ncbi:MAG: hypothetical protein PHV99_03590, partial [Candidatus Pacebacteria bacterium]|nr:hypothetical protein [Candidatus Paceibacterota bacterium]